MFYIVAAVLIVMFLASALRILKEYERGRGFFDSAASFRPRGRA